MRNLSQSEVDAIKKWRRSETGQLVRELVRHQMKQNLSAIAPAVYTDALATAQANAARGCSELEDLLFENDFTPNTTTPEETFGK